jgi:hypothetical protein
VSTKNHRHRSRVTDAEIAESYGVSLQKVAEWRAAGAQFSHQQGGLAVYEPGYPVPADIRPGKRRR